MRYKKSHVEPIIRTQWNEESFTITCIYTDDTMGRLSDLKEQRES